MSQESQGGESTTLVDSPTVEVLGLVSNFVGQLVGYYSLLLPSSLILLTDPFGNPHLLLVAGQLQIAAWKLSGRDKKQQEFRERLHSSWQLDGEREQTPHTRVEWSECNGIAGVLNSKWIPFQALP